MFPGDVVHEKYLIECKITDKESYRLSLNTVEKIENEAHSVNKEWVMVVQIGSHSLAIIDYDRFLEMVR